MTIHPEPALCYARGKAFASKLSAVSEATSDSSAASTGTAASFSMAAGQAPAMSSPFSAWAAQRQRRKSRLSDEDETSSVDSQSQHDSVPTSPHARDPTSPSGAPAGPRSVKDDSSMVNTSLPGSKQEAGSSLVGTPKQAGKSYAAVVADGSQVAQNGVASSVTAAVTHRAGDAATCGAPSSI